MANVANTRSTKRRGFEVQHVRTNAFRAIGQIAYAKAYDVAEELGKMREEREIINCLTGRWPGRGWSVEYLHPTKNVWLTADRSLQGHSLEGARRLVAALGPKYRLLVRDKHSGAWKIAKRPRWN